MSENILVLSNIHKEYRQGKINLEVLQDINLTVKAGELIAIVGNSGCGKSTLLHIAGLLDNPDKGEVRVCDINYSSNNSNNNYIRLNYIGFVYQYHHLLSDFSARENVAMPKIIAGGNYLKALSEADELLLKLGLKERRHNLPGELSGGEQQRVAIARSLINNPKVILADEPTGNLDPHTAEEVFKLFIDLAAGQDTAVVMVTHNHGVIKRMHKAYELKYGLLQPLMLDKS